MMPNSAFLIDAFSLLRCACGAAARSSGRQVPILAITRS